MAEYDIYPPFNYNASGRPLKFKPEELLDKFREFILWAKEHPITVVKKMESISTKGETYGSEAEETKPRLISIGGFLVYLGESFAWWTQLDDRRDGEKFVKVKTFIREYCENYQKEMASADIFNANIISRLLGLADRKDVTSGGDKIDRIIVQSQEEKDKIANMNELDV